MSAAPQAQPEGPLQTPTPGPYPLPPTRKAKVFRRAIKSLIWLVILSALAAGGAAVYRFRQAQDAAIPVAQARKGEFLVLIRTRGELKAGRSAQIYAPVIPSLRIGWLAPGGEPIEKGAVVIKFDSSAAEQQLQQRVAALRQAQASLDQQVAQAKITAEQDKSDLADAQYNVERARLEASKTEIVSKIQGEEDKIDLGVAEAKLRVEQATVELHDAADRAKRGSLTRLRDQAQNDVDITKSRIAQMQIQAPLSGILTFNTNNSQGWMNVKPYQVGDNVCPGCAIAEIPDLSTLEMEGRIEETDRGRIAEGQDVRVRVDSLPELLLPGKIAHISPLAELSNEYPPTRSFRAYAPIAHPDAHLRPGMNGGMDVIVSRIPDAISIPAKALFTHSGKPIVYLMTPGSSAYRAREVQVLARNPDEVAIAGIPADSHVAIVDPTKQEKK
jgi:HlyD family secretion protein